jgi:acetyl esterase/lipase
MRPALPLALAALLLGCGAPAPAADEPQALRGLAYAAAGGDSGSRTLDLYLPDAESPPLVVFADSRFWRDMPEEWALPARFAWPLRGQGAAVAVVRQRPAPEQRHPAQAEDLASAVAWLVENAGRFGYDAGRLYLVGHSSGAQLAALLALDPRYLEAKGLTPDDLSGVVCLSGIYDLDPGDAASAEERQLYERVFGGSQARRGVSPVRLARADAPPFLLISAERDVPGYAEAATAFEAALRGRGHRDVRTFVALARDHTSIFDLGQTEVGVSLFLLHFVGLRDLPATLEALDAAERYWSSPRFSSAPFFERGVRVQTHAADARFREETRRLFVGSRRRRAAWAPREFHALDLYEYLDARGDEVGSGPWLTLTNVQMEKVYLHLDEIRALRPLVVIGIDGVRNLFSVVDLHQAERAYSWREDDPRPPPSARPMGAFLYFMEPPAKPLLPRTFAQFSLVEKSFQRSAEDPLAPLRDLDPELFSVMTVGNGCIHCHRFRDIGTNAGHLRAVDAEFQGGFALPLTKYPPPVWRRFVFDQAAVARIIGVSPNVVQGPAARRLYELVERERDGS